MSNLPGQPPADALSEGLYDQLLDTALASRLDQLDIPGLAPLIGEIDPGEAHSVLAQYLERLILRGLSQHRGKEQEKQLAVAQRIIDLLRGELNSPELCPSLKSPLQRLLAIHSSQSKPARPHSPLGRSTLITGSKSDLKLGIELSNEIRSAESVDILCSFILWSGLRMILDSLRELTARKPLESGRPRLRVITTSYMGNTEIRAMEELLRLPNTETKVNYDTKHGRLHAKAYLIHRPTGFGSAYIGSANLSKSALSEGLEWTTKVSQFELPHLWAKVTNTFDGYWQDAEFEHLTQECLPKLKKVLQLERQGEIGDNQLLSFVDVRPHPFQQEILDALHNERVLGKNRHLVVAATGTGKTMVAAFDFREFAQDLKDRPSLLFIAHREEILHQALATFRVVLRDQNFGELVVGGSRETDSNHLFCTIQSYTSRDFNNLPADRFDYVVVDEFHHAAASSYLNLLNHIQPKVLLGLTATPERADNLDILSWFDGRPSAEIRLPDAIGRDLLASFQYFGITDSASVDLSTLSWQRGGYKLAELDGILSNNTARAGLVMDKVREILLDPFEARALGFCVSIQHARFMADQFNRHHFRAATLSSESTTEERWTVQRKLVAREINFLFVVDLYNEGVDIPEIDTVLFLRPTESLAIFLQQLGRGLRKHKGKQCLTVLDFISAHRREYRFASRFRALLADKTSPLTEQLENDFPNLPPGCMIRLEKVAKERVLDNIRVSLASTQRAIIYGLREFNLVHGRCPTMLEAADFMATDIPTLCLRGLWARMLKDAALYPAFELPGNLEKEIANGLHRASHWDDADAVKTILNFLEGRQPTGQAFPMETIRIYQFLTTALGKASESLTLPDAIKLIQAHRPIVDSIRALFETLLAISHPGIQPLANKGVPLTLHCQYSRDEALLGLGRWTYESRPSFREGVLHLPEKKLDVFFVTLQKTEADYSPTTLYEDFALSPSEFHWQTQSTTAVESETGNRYLRHRDLGYTPLLFVREKRTTNTGRASPYHFLGPCCYLRHSGNRPISIVWKLEHPMPARLFRQLGLEGVA